MKRNKSLYLLSHDHHHGLVEANRLRNMDYNIDEKSLIEVRDSFLKFCDDELMKHFRAEEEILFPVFAKYSGEDNTEIIETLKQHTEIRKRISEIKGTHGREASVKLLKSLGDLLKEHIRFEERQVFPLIEAAVPEIYLKQVEEQIKNF